MKNCKFCDHPEQIAQWLVKAYCYWTIYIHPNQCYLGRCFVVLNRHLDDFYDLDEPEIAEYFTVGKKLRDAAQTLFQPDVFNYAVLGNDVRHVHLNFVPRYSRPVSFAGVNFEDKRWGANYSPYDNNFSIDPKTFDLIIKALKEQVKK